MSCRSLAASCGRPILLALSLLALVACGGPESTADSMVDILEESTQEMREVETKADFEAAAKRIGERREELAELQKAFMKQLKELPDREARDLRNAAFKRMGDAGGELMKAMGSAAKKVGLGALGGFDPGLLNDLGDQMQERFGNALEGLGGG